MRIGCLRRLIQLIKQAFPTLWIEPDTIEGKGNCSPFWKKFVKVWPIVFWNLKTTLSPIPCLLKSVKWPGRNVPGFAGRILEMPLTKDSVLHRIFYFYGYKLQGVCSVNGVFHSIELTKASVHDVTFLKAINSQLSDGVLIGDKGYLSSSLQLDLFHSAHIQ